MRFIIFHLKQYFKLIYSKENKVNQVKFLIKF